MMQAKGERLDVYLAETGLAVSREKARALIMAGEVYVNNEPAAKASLLVTEKDEVRIKAQLPYVSRGGLKLEKAMAAFPIDLRDKICIDIGASTGGFTDCMLQKGACKVYSVDVGYGQLDYKLRTDPRVVVMERTNARFLSRESVPDPIDFASIDVSFISLKLIFPALYGLMAPEGHCVALIKPQFEAGREKVGKNGVVRDAAVHREVISGTLNAAQDLGFYPLGLTYSPIKGPKGNIEFLVYLAINPGKSMEFDVETILKEAHSLA